MGCAHLYITDHLFYHQGCEDFIEMESSNTYISITEAAERSGLHPNSLRRLLRQGEISGYKISSEGKVRWRVSLGSLRWYADPIEGVVLDRPGPKRFIKQRATQ
jgi:hypothetical protein